MLKKSFISRLVEIRDSPIEGKGMFAKEKIPKDAILMKWGGKFLTDKEIKNLKKRDFIMIQVEDNLYSVEPRNKPEDDSYFINQSFMRFECVDERLYNIYCKKRNKKRRRSNC